MTHKVIPSSIGINFLGIKYNSGAVWEEKGKKGTSHLMEHLACKTFDHLLSDLKSEGIDYNAYTSNNCVVFHFSGLDFALKKFSQNLLDCITKPENLWSEDDFNNEKRTVLQEYGDSFNDQNSAAFEDMNRKYYNHFGAIGLREDIEAFTYQNSLDAMKDFARPKLICEVGESFVKFDGEFCTKQMPKNLLKFGIFDNPFEPVPKDDKTLVGMLGTKIIAAADANKLKLVVGCLTDGLESPLYQEIREKRGLSYFSYGSVSSFGYEAAPSFFASTDNDQAGALAELYRDIFSREGKDLISKERFEICKKALLIEKVKAERLPHSGQVQIAMAAFNPFNGIEEFTYDEALNLFKEHLKGDSLYCVSY